MLSLRAHGNRQAPRGEGTALDSGPSDLAKHRPGLFPREVLYSAGIPRGMSHHGWGPALQGSDALQSVSAGTDPLENVYLMERLYPKGSRQSLTIQGIFIEPPRPENRGKWPGGQPHGAGPGLGMFTPPHGRGPAYFPEGFFIRPASREGCHCCGQWNRPW